MLYFIYFHISMAGRYSGGGGGGLRGYSVGVEWRYSHDGRAVIKVPHFNLQKKSL
jgi:hypothetical protein